MNANLEKDYALVSSCLSSKPVSWSTTYTPLQQYGLVPLFVDVDAFGNIDYEDVE